VGCRGRGKLEVAGVRIRGGVGGGGLLVCDDQASHGCFCGREEAAAAAVGGNGLWVNEMGYGLGGVFIAPSRCSSASSSSSSSPPANSSSRIYLSINKVIT
jgi:hypothetical protein